MNTDELISYEKEYGPLLYGSKDTVFIRGKGALLYSADGREFIDFVAGHGVGNIGHSHPDFVKAVQHQLENLIVLHSAYPNDQRAKFLKKIGEIAPKPLSNAFISNSGAESVEAAIKLAIVAHRNVKKPHIIAMKRSFHGRTLGALSLTFGRNYREAFENAMGIEVSFASFGDIDSVKELIKENTVAIITEIVQGEGGIYVAPKEFPKELREVADQHDLTLIFDEVQSGVGRTGTFFAFEQFDTVPDVVCLAKSIAGGVPMGVTVANRELFENFKKGEHASTFGGNPLSCAAANATIDIIYRENLMENARKIGKEFEKRVNEWINDNEKIAKLIKENRGLGAMRGIQLRGKAGKYLKKAYDRGLLLLNAGMTVVRALPPLVTPQDVLDKALSVLYDVLNE